MSRYSKVSSKEKRLIEDVRMVSIESEKIKKAMKKIQYLQEQESRKLSLVGTKILSTFSLCEKTLEERARELIVVAEIKQSCFDKLSEPIDASVEIVLISDNPNEGEQLKDIITEMNNDCRLVVKIGSIIIGWTKYSLVVPMKESGAILLTMSTEPLCEKTLCDKNIEALCKVISYWNGCYVYNRFTNSERKFTTEVLEALGLKTIELR